MLLQADHSCLLLVDVQQRLMPAVQHGTQVVEHATWLVRLARTMDVPVRVTEQYPQGLGSTVESLRELVGDDEVLTKVHFCANQSDGVRNALAATGRRQLVVAGAEAHVCVLQTVLGLLAEGYTVFVVADAISSRNPRDAELARQRLRDAGATLVSPEMVAFEWLERADNDTFRRIHRDFIR